MGDESSEDSSDDSFSYKNTAKRAFEAAKKKKAEVKSWAIATATVNFSSESDDNSKCKDLALPVRAKTSTQLKRKSVRQNAGRKCKKLKKKSGSTVIGSSGDSSPQKENVVDVCSTDSNSEEDSTKLYADISSTGLTSKPSIDLEVATCVLDSDEPETDVDSEVAVVLSDSSELEILSPPEITVVPKDDERTDANEVISIKISWKLQPIQKFQLRRHQKFKALMEHFAKLEGVPLQKVVIYGGKNNCRLIEPFDTPDTVGVTVTDILEGGVLIEGCEMRAQRLRGLAGQHGDGITVRVQLEGVRSFPVMIGRNQRMQLLLVKVAEQMEVNVDKVRLSLDGEVISSASTAAQLDLEEGDVLDLHLL